jgi:hypothetical protein
MRPRAHVLTVYSPIGISARHSAIVNGCDQAEVSSGLVIPECFDLHLIFRTTVRGDLFAVRLVQPGALQTLVRLSAKFRDSSIQDASRLMLVQSAIVNAP